MLLVFGAGIGFYWGIDTGSDSGAFLFCTCFNSYDSALCYGAKTGADVVASGGADVVNGAVADVSAGAG